MEVIPAGCEMLRETKVETFSDGQLAGTLVLSPQFIDDLTRLRVRPALDCLKGANLSQKNSHSTWLTGAQCTLT